LDADLYLQTSRAETFGMAVAEAMAIGLPVVASDVGGMAELIDDGCTGVLVPPDDPSAVADAVAALLDDTARVRALTSAAHAAVATLTVEHMVDELVAVWWRAIHRKGAAR
jgi:glycosyltransferase involved in cell wall biosynthesis